MTDGYLHACSTRPGALGVQTVQIEDTLEFVLAGELDLSNAFILRDLLAQVLENRTHAASALSRIVLDLQGVTFIDSTGIYALVATKRRCAKSGADLTLRLGDSPIGRILTLAGVTELLDGE